MILPTISSKQLETEPWLLWNAFISVIARDPKELTAEQRAAALVFGYDSEVQNGGHLQYFENRGTTHLQETIAALGELGAYGQQSVLKEATETFLGSSHKRITSPEEYVTAALDDKFGAFDTRFHACSPSLQVILERHLANHRNDFVRLEKF